VHVLSKLIALISNTWKYFHSYNHIYKDIDKIRKTSLSRELTTPVSSSAKLEF